MVVKVIKRDNKIEDFNFGKIESCVKKAFDSVGITLLPSTTGDLYNKFKDYTRVLHIEDIQNIDRKSVV